MRFDTEKVSRFSTVLWMCLKADISALRTEAAVGNAVTTQHGILFRSLSITIVCCFIFYLIYFVTPLPVVTRAISTQRSISRCANASCHSEV